MLAPRWLALTIILSAPALGCGSVDCNEEAAICHDNARAWCNRLFSCDPALAAQEYQFGISDCAGRAACTVSQLGCGVDGYQPQPQGCAMAIDRLSCEEFLEHAYEAACHPTHGPSSSLSACAPQQACSNASEKCFSTAACGPPPGGCQTPENGDLKCHLTCVDDASCAENERCVAQVIFEPPQGTDVPTATRLCLPR
jgi:hypothetical protein